LMDLSLNLKAVISQQLIATPDGQSRRAAVEVMINSPLMSDYIRQGEIYKIKELMARSGELGMQTFDQALFELHEHGQISYADALKHADSPNNLRLQIKLSQEANTAIDQKEKMLEVDRKITFDGQRHDLK